MRSEVKVGLIVLLIIAIPTSLWWLSRGSQVADGVPFTPEQPASESSPGTRLAGDRETPRPAARVPTARLPEPRREPLRIQPVQPAAKPKPKPSPPAPRPVPTTQPAVTARPAPLPQPQRKPQAQPKPAAQPAAPALQPQRPTRRSEPPRKPRGQRYTIQPGDVLIDIAETFYGDGSLWRAIKLANPGLDENRLRIGETIVIPPKDEAQRLLAGHRPPAPPKPGTPPAGTKSSPLVYVVAPGDTLISIARHVLGDETRWEEIYELNRDQLESPDLIVPGMKLKLPQRKATARPASRP